MPIINNLPIDQTVDQADKILVTDAQSGAATKLMTIEQLALYLAQTGKADSGKDSYLYKIVADITAGGQAELLSANVGASLLSQITLSREDINGVDREPIYQLLEGSTVKISVVDSVQDKNYGIYVIQTVTDVAGDRVRLVLTPEEAVVGAIFSSGQTVAITPIAATVSEGNVNPAQLRHGEGAPIDADPDNDIEGTGRNGDFYIDTENEFIYGPRTNGIWGMGTSIAGTPKIGDVTASTIEYVDTPTVTITQQDKPNTDTYDWVFGIPAGRVGTSVTEVRPISGGQNPGESTTIQFTFENADDPSLNKTQSVTIPAGVVGQQGDQGIGISNISGSNDGLGTDTTVTVSYNNPGGDNPPDETFTVPAGAKGDKGDKGDTGDTGATGATGPGYSSVVLNDDDTITFTGVNGNDDYTSGSVKGDTGAKGDTGDNGKTILNGTGAPTDADPDNNVDGTGTDGDFYLDTDGDRLYGPRTNGVWGGATALTSALDISEGSSSVTSITELKIVGTNVSLAADDDDDSIAILTFHGGGGSDISTPVLTFTSAQVSGFEANSFGGDQTISFSPSITANGNTIDSVTYSATNSGFDDRTISTSPYALTSQTVNFASYNGSVAVTATLNYTPPGEAQTSISATVTLTLSKTLPSQVAFVTGNSGFDYTPANRHIEMFDAGTFTVKQTYDGTLNGWTLTADSEEFTPSAADGGSWAISSSETDVSLTVTADFTENSDGTGHNFNNRTVNTSADHYSRIRSVRVGGTTNSSFNSTEIEDLSTWGTDLKFGTTNPNNQTYTLSTTGGERIYILYNASLGDLSGITDSHGNNLIETFTKGTDTSGMRQYFSEPLSSLSNYEITITI